MPVCFAQLYFKGIENFQERNLVYGKLYCGTRVFRTAMVIHVLFISIENYCKIL